MQRAMGILPILPCGHYGTVPVGQRPLCFLLLSRRPCALRSACGGVLGVACGSARHGVPCVPRAAAPSVLRCSPRGGVPCGPCGGALRVACYRARGGLLCGACAVRPVVG